LRFESLTDARPERSGNQIRLGIGVGKPRAADSAAKAIALPPTAVLKSNGMVNHERSFAILAHGRALGRSVSDRPPFYTRYELKSALLRRAIKTERRIYLSD
jgi:hypothetical protein